MGIEIERKFLVTKDHWHDLGIPLHYMQGYIVADGLRTVRVRIAGEDGYLTIKGKTEGISRLEFEYPIPVEEAFELLKLCTTPVIEKYRTKVIFGNKTWEVDEFEGDNKGLVIAEIELKSEDELFELPSWIGEEVTGDLKYYNSRLATYPFRTWYSLI